MTKLTKAQEKRFDEGFSGYFEKPSHYDVVMVKKRLKQHLADELARQREELLKDINEWYENSGYANGTWVEAKRYLEKKHKVILQTIKK